MDKFKNNKKLGNQYLKTILNFPFFIFLISVQIKQAFAEYFETLQTGDLSNSASLIDITDYYNIYPIITTEKKIYTGIPPVLKTTTTSKIISFSSALTYNENYILMACTEDYLLSTININTGIETPLINYDNFKFPNRTCSISTKDNYIYIGISYIKTPTYRIRNFNYGNENNNSSNINVTNNISCEINDTTCNDLNNENDDNYFIFYDYANTYLENNVIKIKLNNNGDNEPALDENFNILNYTFEYQDTNIDHIPISRPFSCEVINIDDITGQESRLVCGFLIVNETSENKFSYQLNATVMNNNFDEIEDNKEVNIPKKMPYFRLQRIDETHIRYLLTSYSFVISLKLEDSECKIVISQTAQSFYTFRSTGELFYYNNQYLFSASSSDIYIKRNISNNYIKIGDNKIIEKIIGYYKEDGDILIFIYEYYSHKIKYITIEGRGFLFEFKTNSKILEVKSNTLTNFDVNELITSPTSHEHLSFDYLTYYISTKKYNSTYNKYSFNKDTQILRVEESLNDWISFYFYYNGQTSGLSTGFYLENAKVTIKTCLFKCGHCYSNFSECDYGTCKTNFSLYRSSDDKECYANDQNFPNYIYNETTNYFEQCYETCIFCSIQREYSSAISQNCKVCQEGYLKSYNFPGNCYPLDYPHNTSNYSKIISSIDGSFEIVDSCFDLNKYKINDTGECIDSCPRQTVYHTYYFNESLDFSKQEESYIGLLWPLNKEKSPQFLFNKVCYSYCPKLTYEDKENYICKCKYGWHKDQVNNDNICYDEMDYCLSLEYYYHTDDKECVLNGCKEGYYQINFECYKDKCPDGSRQISSDAKKCESNLKYCYIDEHYQTQCSNSAYEGYNLKYDNTNLYFRWCNESEYYFNQKTYLYKNICYINCPEETTANDDNNRCSCKYHIYYVNEERADYECLNETEKCWDKRRYNISEMKECVNTKEECTNLGYKVFNDECLQACPIKDEIIQDENGICLCKYYYYNESEILTCFENGKNCESENYPINMDNSNECFITKYNCTNRGFKFYNNICYENSCPAEPSDLIEKYNDGICICNSYYLNNSDILECFEEGITCETHSPSYPYTNIDTNECFNTLDECKNRELKIFNNNCYNICPGNSKPKNDDNSFCICSNYFYTEEDNKVNCFNSSETCETKGYSYINPETKECFNTKDDCINRGYKIFNKECYSDCPKNTEDKNNNNICVCSSYSLFEENMEENNNNQLKCFESERECASENLYFDKKIKNCFSSKEICFQENKKIFDKECLDDCPLNSEIIEPNSQICKCEDYAEEEIDKETGFIKCVYIYPELFYKDRKSCPFVYKKECQLQCPKNTCLTTRTNELVQCVDYKNNMKIYNEICIEGIKEYVQTLEYIQNDDDIIPIITPSGVVLNAVPSDASIDKLIDKYPNFTFVDLCECEDLLREAYHLPPNIKLYIVGIDTPNLYGNSSINVFNFEIYLKNGTQIKDLKACNGKKITISSKINDLEIIRFNKATEFYEEDNYDIYNRTDPFYINRCSPADDEGNDITLFDRVKYYYPNVSICNEGCEYQKIDYNKQRFVCNCDANLNEKIYKFTDGEIVEISDEEYDESFSEYVLSLINYKIFMCYNLFFEFKSFYSNAGFYISFTTLIISFILFCIFWIKGVKSIRLIMYQNIPTREKLKEIIKHQKEQNKDRYNTENDMENDMSINDNSNKDNNINFKNIKSSGRITSNKLSNNHLLNSNDSNPNKNLIKASHKNFELLHKSLFLEEIDFGRNGEKEVEIFNIYKKNKNSKQKNNFNKLHSKRNISRKTQLYSKENLARFYNKYINRVNKQINKNKKNNIKKNEEINKIDIFSLNKINSNNEKEHNIKDKSITPEENDSKELMNSIKIDRNPHKAGTHYINRNKINLVINNNGKNNSESDSTNLSQYKAKMVDDLELKIDFNFEHLIDRRDDEVEKRELNNVPYRQALRIDKRSFFAIFISVITNEIDLLNLYFYRHPYSHYSLSISIYLFDLLSDLTMNCFLYTDDVVSEKYHNNGQLSMITSLSLSIISNIISSIIVFIISKLTNYCDIIEEIIKNVKYKRKYFENIIRLFKYIKLRLGVFYFLQFASLLVMTYYLFIFCAVYNKSQGSIMINYIIGALTSLAISIGLTIIITILRTISIKYRSVLLFNISKYLYEHF